MTTTESLIMRSKFTQNVHKTVRLIVLRAERHIGTVFPSVPIAILAQRLRQYPAPYWHRVSVSAHCHIGAASPSVPSAILAPCLRQYPAPYWRRVSVSTQRHTGAASPSVPSAILAPCFRQYPAPYWRRVSVSTQRHIGAVFPSVPSAIPAPRLHITIMRWETKQNVIFWRLSKWWVHNYIIIVWSIIIW